jgi:hypothetical protein
MRRALLLLLFFAPPAFSADAPTVKELEARSAALQSRISELNAWEAFYTSQLAQIPKLKDEATKEKATIDQQILDMTKGKEKKP